MQSFEQADSITPRIAIVGAGIAGLAAAIRLHQLCPQCRVEVFDALSRPGGVLVTSRDDGFLIEQAADNFLSGPDLPWAEQLCRETGFHDRLMPTDPRYRRALVLRRGRPVPIPEGFQLMQPNSLLALWASPAISWRGKLRAVCEPFLPARTSGTEESLAQFATRRLGQEVYARLVEPLIAGIYSADAERLSVQATMPQFVAMERKYGSLWKAARHQRRSARENRKTSGARYARFLAPRDGMASWIDHLVQQLPAGTLNLNCPVCCVVRREGSRWALQFDGPRPEQVVDGLIVAVPAYAAARLLDGIHASLAAELADIPYAGTAVISLGYHRDQMAHPLDAFGCVIPAMERRNIFTISFTSRKFVGRAPEGFHLLRVFAGGALRPDLLQKTDDELVHMACQELEQLLGARGRPALAHVTRWPNAIPQYHVGHLARIERIQRCADQLPGLALAGSAYSGVGIPQCIRSGQTAAQRVAQALLGAETRGQNT